MYCGAKFDKLQTKDQFDGFHGAIFRRSWICFSDVSSASHCYSPPGEQPASLTPPPSPPPGGPPGPPSPPPRPPCPWPRGANETGSSSRIHPFHQKERTVTASLHQRIGAILLSSKANTHPHHPHQQRRTHQSRRDRRGQVCFRAQYRLLPRHRK